MKPNDLMKILFSVSLLFVAVSFNDAFSFTLKLYNIIVILLFVIVIFWFIFWFADSVVKPLIYDITYLFFLFMAGINFRHVDRQMVFLLLFFLFLSGIDAFKLWKKKAAVKKIRILSTAAMSLLSLNALVFMYHFSNIYVVSVSIALIACAGAVFAKIAYNGE